MQNYSLKNHKLNKNQVILILIAVAAFVILAIYGIALAIYRSGKIAAMVKYAPYKATITLNDRRISNNGTVYLEPGKYHLKAEFEHFETYEEDITISETYHDIVGLLTPSDAEGEEYRSKYANQFTFVEGYIGKVLNQQGEALQKQYPIVSHLPITNRLYAITYRRDSPESEPKILIRTDDEFIDVAVDRLKSFKDVDITGLDLSFSTNFSTDLSTSTASDASQFVKESISGNYSVSDATKLSDQYTLVKIYSYNPNLGRGAEYGHYRAILSKKGNTWQFAAPIYPLFTTRNAPGIPVEILKTANEK